MFVRRRQRVKQEGARRTVFLRYLGEVATAASELTATDRKQLYDRLLEVAQKKTAEADVRLDAKGRPIRDEAEEGEDFGDNVLIVERNETVEPKAADPESDSPVE
jgi:DNA topoisomerase-6 subunit B